jgi:hypothetical protein
MRVAENREAVTKSSSENGALTRRDSRKTEQIHDCQ